MREKNRNHRRYACYSCYRHMRTAVLPFIYRYFVVATIIHEPSGNPPFLNLASCCYTIYAATLFLYRNALSIGISAFVAW